MILVFCLLSAGQAHQNLGALRVPLGTTLLQSPGCNEGKARNGTLGKHEYKKIRAPQERHFRREHLSLSRVVPPLKGLNKYIDYYAPGLAPWAMQECRPCRALRRPPPINSFVVLMGLLFVVYACVVSVLSRHYQTF